MAKKRIFTEEEQEKINEAVLDGVVQGLTYKEITKRVTALLGREVSAENIRGRVGRLKIRMSEGWQKTLEDPAANSQMAFLRLESLYSNCIQDKDYKTAFSVWKEQWLLINKDNKPKRREKAEDLTDKEVPEGRLEDFDDDALFAKLNQKDSAGAITSAYADQLIKEDHE